MTHWHWSGELAAVSRRMLNGDPVELVRVGPWSLPTLPPNVTVIEPGENAVAGAKARIVVTDQIVPHLGDVPTAVVNPPSLVVGMGCTSRAALKQLRDLLDHSLRLGLLAPPSVAVIASVQAKTADKVLVELAAELGVPLAGYPPALLNGLAVPNPSFAPLGAIGTPSVCEASVLAHGANLVVTKQRTPEATCAIGRVTAIGQPPWVGISGRVLGPERLRYNVVRSGRHGGSAVDGTVTALAGRGGATGG